jgi:DNA adenine methylase Dam
MIKSPLNYTGSKDKIIHQLIQHFPIQESVDTFWDVFTGGLSVTINTQYDKYISNDIIKPLIDFYRNLYLACQEGSIETEIDKILSHKIDKNSAEQYDYLREKFNETKDPYLFFSLVNSCTNNMMRFNKKFKFNQTFGKRNINDNTIKKLFDYCEVLKSKHIIFENLNFQKLFEKSTPKKSDFVYLDPPYYQITEAGYNAYWSKSDEEDLYDLIDSLDKQGIRFALSGVKMHKGIPNPYLTRLSKYKIIEIQHDYEKVAKNKNIGHTQEILVINY